MLANSQIPVWELHVKPTYSVLIPQRERSAGFKSRSQIANEENLKDNKRKGGLSKKACQRLTNSVNWLVASAKTKYIYDKKLNKRFSFKVNFITLTLPTLDHDITDHQFKSVLLHNFINTCRTKFDLKNFVWKVEAQENGNIHAHFTTDTFANYNDLRLVWNRILSKHGLIEKYKNKHQNLSFHEYNNLYNSQNKASIETMKQAYQYGVDTNWENPNTTDVHAVYKVADISAYLATYMAKKEVGKREIKGRLWGCSQNLSEKNKLVLELCGHEDNDLLDDLFTDKVKYKPIELLSKLTGLPTKIGEIFFYKISDWGTVLKGRLLQEFNKHRFNIRYGLDFEALRTSAQSVITRNTQINVIFNQV